ncbi:MAG: class I SAM-dependent methyltransferase [Sideroxydans sp.]|nr:class I SAM-dependent methyltransferase [Sideroxydans sp.]
MNTQTLAANQTNQNRASHELNTQGYSSRVRFILKLLSQLKYGALHLQLPDGQSAHFGDDSYPITLHLRDWTMFDAVMKSGDIGFAETYIADGWTTDNLTGLIELFIRNRDQVESLIYGKWWGNLLYRIRHLFNRNSRSGSRKNIHAHYDIGNDFYRLWLDPSMTYSSALFDHTNTDDLQAGQLAKYRRIVQQLRLQRGDSVLEIGCGWGGFAEVAAQEAGGHVTGLTLSTEQLTYAQQRMAAAGLSNRADLKLMDYRDSNGEYDAIASIEMFEAVGEAYWPTYFECIARNLKQGGRACIQTIVIADELFERYRTSTDFIQQYIFPGGMLPSPQVFREQAEKQGLKVVDEFAFGLDYARTLVEWRTAFHQKLRQVRAQGFDERFVLTWEFYLCYCEAAFRAGSTNVMHFTLEKA